MQPHVGRRDPGRARVVAAVARQLGADLERAEAGHVAAEREDPGSGLRLGVGGVDVGGDPLTPGVEQERLEDPVVAAGCQ